MSPRRARACSLLPLLLAGCGGSSHHSSTPISSTDTVGPQIALAWPARARAFTAPGTATAAYVTFPGASPTGADVTQLVTRPEGTTAVTKTYQLGVAVHPGRHLLRVDFMADSTSGGQLATASVNVQVTDKGEIRTLDGKTLPTIAYDSTVTGLTIAQNQTLDVGGSIDLVVSATTTAGIVALKPGSVTLNLTSGAGVLKVNADGSITGLTVGSATLTASADSVTSAAASVIVLAAPVVARSLSVEAADLVFDPTRSAIWVASGNDVAPFDPASATLGTPIALTAAPSTLALSDDGTTLYAGLQSLGTVRRIDLTTNTPGTSFTLPNSSFGGPTYAQQMAVRPDSVSTLAIVRRGASGGSEGLAIFDDGIAQPNSVSLSNSPRSLWLGPNRLLGYPTDFGGVDDVAADASGATISRTVTTQADLTRPLVLSGGRLFAANGIVLDSDTLESIGAFTVPSSTSPSVLSGPAVDSVRKRAYYIEIGYGSDSNRLHIYDTESYTEVANRRISGLTVSLPYNGLDTRMTLVGDRLVFRLSDKIVVLDGVSTL